MDEKVDQQPEQQIVIEEKVEDVKVSKEKPERVVKKEYKVQESEDNTVMYLLAVAAIGFGLWKWNK